MAKQQEDPRQKVRDDLRVLRNDARELLEATKDDVSDRTRQARERLTKSLDEVGERITGLGEQAKETADRTIQEKPYQVIAGALGLGFIIGLWMRGGGSSR
jgi:ElaB/YqjD/DUF883 family membrane-anchored ribosome-binding protein